MKKKLNQKLISLIEYYNLINANILLSNKSINRTIATPAKLYSGTKAQKLEKLKKTLD